MGAIKIDRKPTAIAAGIGAAVIVLVGVGYRVLAARLAAPVQVRAVSAESLRQLPLKMAEWEGREVPLDEEIVRATDTDAYVNRQYSRYGGLESVGLYIAYGVRARDLMPHRPEVCYTGAGWTLEERREIPLELDNGELLPCNVLEFSRGSLSKSRVMLLHYYIVDGQYSADVSLLRSKAWRGSGTIRYMAQVQIVTPLSIGRSKKSATAMLSDFAVRSASPITAAFEGPAEPDNSTESAQ